MISPTGEWTRFSSEEETLTYMKACGLAAAGAAWLKDLTYLGFYTDGPVRCSLVGSAGPDAAVIELAGGLHCVNTDHLRDMQRGAAASSMPLQYVVLDIETTGFRKVEDSIIEIAAVRFRNGAEAGRYSALVKAEVPLPLDIQALTGITPDMLSGAPRIGEVLPGFLDFIGADPLVGHNLASFDLPFLQYKAQRLGLKILNSAIDTLPLARKAYPELPRHTLEFLKEALSIAVSTSHRALPDVLTTAALYQRCADRLLAGGTVRSG